MIVTLAYRCILPTPWNFVPPILPPDDDLLEEVLSDLGSGTVREIVVAPDAAGDRLDRVLAALVPDVSRARIQALMAQGALMFEGKIISDVSAKAKAGTYVLVMPAPIAALPAPENLPLTVLFEDAHLIVIDKAAGMAAHPAPGTPNGTLVNALLFHCADSLSGIGGVARPGIVHRLDKDTSGVMVAAKSDAAHAGLSALFAAHDLDRVYTALVRGVPEPQGGLICTQIGRSPTDRKKMAVLKDGGREAITRQLSFIQSDAKFAALAAEDCDCGHVRDLLHGVMQLRSDATQLKVVVATAGQRQGEHGHVVNGPGFHQRLRRTGRNQVVVCAELLIQADDTAFLVLPHHKANNGERHAGTGSGVDILHTGNLRQQLFHGLRDALFHFTRGSPWQLNHDVHHRDNDLRLFFAG